jgi:hypothetical protein
MNFRKTLIAGSAAFSCLLAGRAHAQTVPSCSDTTMFPNPIYLSGSSAFEPTAGLMAVKLSAQTGVNQYTIIYSATSSCDGPTHIQAQSAITGTADVFTVNAANAAVALKSSCTLAANTIPDVGVSDIFYENCPGNTLPIPTGMVDTQGPVQSMIFIVPKSNMTNTSLSAAEAQDIWGCGMSGGVEPFTSDMSDTMQRSSGSGTQGIVAKAINVPPTAFKGVANSSGGVLVTTLLAAPDPGSAIGFLAADSYDSNRGMLSALAFEAFGQTNAYYADSTASTFDKHNTRDGHYLVWGPEHFFAAADATGKITNTKAASFIGWVNGTVTTPAFNMLDIAGTANVVPQCAMKVTRDQDGGFIRPYTPAAPCGCYWESIATKTAAPAGCTACTADTDCTGGKHCSNKFCE